jgi:small subunit ribosomal protein S1
MTHSFTQDKSRQGTRLDLHAVQEAVRPEKERTPLRKQLLALVLDEYDYARPHRGQIREGVILDIGDNDMIVDVGAKRDGIVPPRDLELLDETYRESLAIGDRVPVSVLRSGGREEGLKVSIHKGMQQQDWLRAKDYMAKQQVFDAQVIDVNRGGVLVQFGRLRGFVPNSHLTSIPRRMRAELKGEAKQKLVGQTLPLVVIEVTQRRRRLVMSQRQARRQRRAQLLHELTEGDVRTGIVVNLVGFGAFVDLGGADGLIHISELDWRHVSHPREVLDVGDEVEVYVLSIDREKERIGLSRKRVLPDPWYTVTGNLQMGQTVQGKVTNVVDFGAFVDLGEGIEGLIHISEIPGTQLASASLEPGSPIAVRVLKIDQARRRIGLSLRDVRGTTPFEHP